MEELTLEVADEANRAQYHYSTTFGLESFDSDGIPGVMGRHCRHVASRAVCFSPRSLSRPWKGMEERNGKDEGKEW